MKVRKRSGELQDLDIRKIMRSVQYNSRNLSLEPDFIDKVKVKLYDGMPTSTIMTSLATLAASMASLKGKNLNYDKLAANLTVSNIEADVTNSTKTSSLYKRIMFMFNKGYYPKRILDVFGEEKIKKFAEVRHEIDFSYIGISTLANRFLLTDSFGNYLETPLMKMFMVSLDIASRFDDEVNRSGMFYTGYSKLCNFEISLPSPEMTSLGTDSTHYASCCVIEIGDEACSWTEGLSAIINHTMDSQGIGADASMVASAGDLVRNGTIKHGGKIPLYKLIDSAIQSSVQNGRRGATTLHTFITDPEIESILLLKNPKTEAVKRINDAKHTIKINKFLFKKILAGEDILLFSPRVIPELYENYHDVEKFEEIYNANAHLATDTLNGRDLFRLFIKQARVETAVYYLMLVDNMNGGSNPFKEVIKQSNLCLEIALPTKPIGTTEDYDKDGVAICILSNINLDKNDTREKIESSITYLVYAQNAIVPHQKHPTEEANNFIKNYNALGLGASNLAYVLASLGYKYGSNEANSLVASIGECMKFYALQASLQYAIEFDKVIPAFHKTIYTETDWVEKLPNVLFSDEEWMTLAKQIQKYGLANSALLAIPPSETSSIIGNQTSSLEPIRALVTSKAGENVISQFAPEAKRLAGNYEGVFESKDITKRYLTTISYIQPWICQAISIQTFYNPSLYSDGKIPFKTLLSDISFAVDSGLKSLYYNNIFNPDSEKLLECESCSV